MAKFSIVFFLYPMFCSCLIYIDHVKLDVNPKLANVSVQHAPNAKGESVSNITIVSYVNVTKLLVYVSLRIPENKSYREYKQELVKTVADVEKVLKGLQSNPVVNGFVDNILK